MKAIFIFSLFFLFSCAGTSRTKYQAYEKKQGYRERENKGPLKIVNFKANSNTRKKDAELFAKFRAIELCYDKNKKVANIIYVKDLTASKEIVRSSSTGFPSYYYGMSPYYGRFHSGFGLGFSTMSSNSWEETYVFPEYEVYFECADVVFGPELEIREVSPEEMKLLVKDLKGALQVEKVLANSINEKVVDTGDVIIKINSARVENIPQLLLSFSPEKTEARMEFFREGMRKTAILKSQDITSIIEESQNKIIQSACKKTEIKSRKICK